MSTIQEFLAQNEKKELLRFSTCGSIDDGKSTLIGRLLHDSKNVYEDQLASVKNSSREKTSDEKIDFALITDGLKAEREQMITIDVAYRYFSTPKRKFIIADTPGHVQYTRNMATGASTANLAILLIDARNGISDQTRRHAFIVSLLGVPHIVVAVNKMDAVDYSEKVYNEIKEGFEAFSHKLKIVDIRFVPISALKGDNVVSRSARMPWYDGESLLELLETIYIGSDRNLVDLRFPVQYVIRPDMSYRGYAGTVTSGVIRKGDEVLALPSMKSSRVKSITTFDGEIEEACAPMSVAVTLEDELDISRGEMLVHPHNVPQVSKHLDAMLVWMGDEPLDPGKSYFIKHTTQVGRVRVDQIRYKVDINTLSRTSDMSGLVLNEIGRVALTSFRPLFCDSYTKNRGTGCFVLIDTISNATVAAGMILDREPESQMPVRMTRGKPGAEMHHREGRIALPARMERYGQKPATIWITGLVASGKTDVAYALERKLFDLGGTAVVLDGENVRMGLSSELDFSPEGRAEHLRRVSEMARMLNDAGLLVICAFVSPTAFIREQASEIIGKDRYQEIHLDAPVEWCETRDQSGLYRRARAGDVDNLAGINAPYEKPQHPALRIEADKTGAEPAADLIVAHLRKTCIFPYVPDRT
ncbi:MAG TPA: sulfate adenylyltransferase subunit CysN [Kiritimatiellia bacterium]|nr:sulfate adenylyltransferase subunit CysN [Kiritimatiellia bacterium]HNS80558.1 sulfate adenylyltransferase subunit CysN [Kiritimatiellia bacterium]HPA77131.1 sulfate adenylyltransferase subunit CysN [Kiritimatiellia bacterium]HQQ03302.1 sulfate adenylyltransferase subunit CysN [Kiritimatiellia bacterium]